MPNEKSDRETQAQDIAKRTRKNLSETSVPFGSGDEGTNAFTSHVRQRMRKQGEEAAAKGYKRGGRVRRTGIAKVHKGERVLTVKQAKRYRGKGR